MENAQSELITPLMKKQAKNEIICIGIAMVIKDLVGKTERRLMADRGKTLPKMLKSAQGKTVFKVLPALINHNLI